MSSFKGNLVWLAGTVDRNQPHRGLASCGPIAQGTPPALGLLSSAIVPPPQGESSTEKLGTEPPNVLSSHFKAYRLCSFFFLWFWIRGRTKEWPVAGGCTAKYSPIFFSGTSLYFNLNSGCALGGTFSFLLPGDYLAGNPGGPVSVKLSFGWNTLRTTIVYTGVICC